MGRGLMLFLFVICLCCSASSAALKNIDDQILLWGEFLITSEKCWPEVFEDLDEDENLAYIKEKIWADPMYIKGTDTKNPYLYIGKRGCLLHPLLMTDGTWRMKALSYYNPFSFIKTLWSFRSEEWKSDQHLISYVLNPFFIADDQYNISQIVEYYPALTAFVINGKEFWNFEEEGLYKSMYVDDKGVLQYYLYTDNEVIMQMPNDLIQKKLVINTLDDLLNTLKTKFYGFKESNGYTNCRNQPPSGMKANDAQCKFLTADTGTSPNQFGGGVIAFRRVIVRYLKEDVITAFLDYANTKVENNIQMTYLEFFLWLAMRSYRERITFQFKRVAGYSDSRNL